MEQNSASSSSLIKPLSHGEFSEESGWTDYIDDFEKVREDGEEENDEEGASFMSASMVSDAGSGPEWKLRNLSGNSNNNYNYHQSMIWCGLPNMPKRLNLMKKKRAQEISCDDSLEDTASSPVNSPKITMNFKRMDINSRKADDNHEGYMGKSTTIGEQCNFKMTSDMKEFNNNKHDHEAHQYCNDLEKKGLCLVPVSMIMNYVD